MKVAIVCLSVSIMILTACTTTGGEGEGEGEGEGANAEGEGEEGEGEEGEGEEGEGEVECDVTPGTEFGSPDYAINAAAALALRAQLDALTGSATMRGSEEGTVVVDALSDLTTPFDAADPSLSSITHDDFTAVVDDAFAEFIELVAAGDQTLVDAGGEFTPGTAGGIYASTNRGINEGGIEVRQIVDKGMFGGVFYRHALSLTAGTINVATIDALAAIWGGNPTLDPAGDLADSAKYTYGMGYHQQAKEALIDARAYAASPLCVSERDAAVVAFFRVWEQAMLARFAFYANVGITKVAAAADADGYASAMHDLAEGLGLAAGFIGVEAPTAGPLATAHRIATDSQITTMLEALGVNLGDLGASTTGSLLIEGDFAAAVLTVEADLSTALDLDAAAVQAWRAPTDG